MGLIPVFKGSEMPEFDTPLKGAEYMMDVHRLEVLPLHPASKKPVPGGWPKLRFNRQTLENIYSADPEGALFNFGVNAGLSGLIIVDVDNKGDVHGSAAWAAFQESKGFTAPPTFTVKSPSGGYHYYFRGKSATSTSKLGEGIDTRGEGGQVVCPGSVTEDGTYLIVSDEQIADAPPELLAALEKPAIEIKELLTDVPFDLPHNIDAAIEHLQTTSDVCVENVNGDANLFKAFANLKDRGISKEKAWALISEHFNPRCLPAFDMDGADEELCRAKLEQGYKTKNAPGINTPEARIAECKETFSVVENSTPKILGSLPLVSAWLVLNRSTPRRDWIMDGYLLRSFLSITGAPGGTGKSNFEILKALAVVTGKPFLGEQHRVPKPGPFVLYNCEDPIDEMARRVKAFCVRLGLTPEDVRDLHLVSGRDHSLSVGKLHEGDGIPEGSIKIGQGVEHQVFHKDGDTRVTKLTKPGEFGLSVIGKERSTPISYLERLALQNKAFGDDIKWEGISGDNRTITSQPVILALRDAEGKAVPASPEEIKTKMESRGFASTGPGEWYNPKERIIASDAFPRNFIKDIHGKVHALDLILKKATAQEHAEFSKQPEVRNQDARGAISFGDGKTIIHLFKTADLSTVLHETGHLFLHELQSLVAEGHADAQAQADLETLRLHGGAKPGEALTVPQEEKIVKSFESYLREGKAPSIDLAGPFSRFRSWLTNIYRSATSLGKEPRTQRDEQLHAWCG